MNRKVKEVKGITLIALVVTIVVLLILATVSIQMLGGDQGIIKQAVDAKDKTTVAKEKESISLAKAAIKSRGQEINQENLQKELDAIEGEGKTTVSLRDDLSGLDIYFVETKNKYSEDVGGYEISDEEASYWSYEENEDGTITLVKYNPPIEKATELTELIIPNQLFGKKVSAVGAGNYEDIWGENIVEKIYAGSGYYYGQTTIKKLIILNGITTINDNAFRYLKNTTEITIPKSVTIIDHHAFESSGLEKININNEMAKIGNEAFHYTTFYNNQPNGDVYIGNIYYVYKNRYSMPKDATINIKDGTINIADGAFYKCANLANINIPNSVKTIGDYSFNDCSGMKNIVIPDSVTYVGKCAFQFCSSATNLRISKGVNNIKYGTFSGCGSLTNITIPDNVIFMEGEAFSNCKEVTDVIISENITTIGDGAFRACKALKNVVIPDSVTSIEGRAFSDCESLVGVTISSNVKSIKDYAFADCDNLVSINIPKSVTFIGTSVFTRCANLTIINVEATSIPNTWNSYWKGDCTATVNLGVSM